MSWLITSDSLKKTVSNTEVTAYNTCTRMHDYMYNQGIGPKRFSSAIYRGVIGHEALAAYYLEIKEGRPELALKAAQDVVMKEMARVALETPEEFDTIKLLMDLKSLLEIYARVYAVETFRPLEIEKIYMASVNDEANYGMILDVLGEYISGPYKGDIVVVDHKFVYNFKSASDLDMDAQMPKYIKTVRANGYTVGKAMFNQLRYRQLKVPSPKDLFQRSSYKPLPGEMDTVWAEQLEAVEEIMNAPRAIRRTQSPFICKSCFYQPLCKAELSGADTTHMRVSMYEKRSRPLKNIAEDAA